MAANIRNNPAIRLIWWWSPVVACMYLIFYASSMPAKDIPPLFPFQDIFFHGTIYATLAFLFWRAVKNTFSGFTYVKILIITLVFTAFYGLSDELHQLFVPGRSCSLFDLIIDFTGSCLGSLIGGLYFKWLR
jgi:hypothetical protein